MSSRTRMRGELSLAKNHTELFFSANPVYNTLISDYSGFKIRELFVSQTFGGFELRAGRQIITWGVADALRLTDLVSPMDYSEFLAQDYDDIRIPENALRLKFSKNSFSAEALAVPLIETFDLPIDVRNPWAISITGNDSIIADEKPDFKIENMEFGGRLSWFLSGVDFSVSALRTYNKMPVYSILYLSPNEKLIAIPQYERMTMTGFIFLFLLASLCSVVNLQSISMRLSNLWLMLLPYQKIPQTHFLALIYIQAEIGILVFSMPTSISQVLTKLLSMVIAILVRQQ